MVLRSFIVVSALASIVTALAGCAAQPATSAAAAPTFRNPHDIRPADLAVEPTPSPSVASAKPTTAAPAIHATGVWAPPVTPRQWKYIVLHHSASPSGNAALFDREHRDKGWDELGYHFVIDNGRGGPDGNVEIGPRWTKQKWGAHAKTPDNRYNDFGIGICFVGNFEQGKPTAKQLAAASKLVAWLMETYNIPEANVIGHEDTGKQTLCPGRNLSVARVRTLAEQMIAQASGSMAPLLESPDELPAIARVASAPIDRELLRSR